MKLAIIAATGGVGQQLLRQALGAGHDVTAVVRNPAKLRRRWAKPGSSRLTWPARNPPRWRQRSPEPTR